MTRGFFDVHNVPPVATWAAYFEDPDGLSKYLLAWIPQVLQDACAEGVEATAEDCMAWLGDRDVALRALVAGGQGGLEATWLSTSR